MVIGLAGPSMKGALAFVGVRVRVDMSVPVVEQYAPGCRQGPDRGDYFARPEVLFGVAIPTYDMADDAVFMVEAAQAAEALGYHSMWFADHVVMPTDFHGYPTDYRDPLVVASYLAACTRRIKIGWDVLAIPYRNPLVLAKMIATLDSLTGGRVIVGGGTGNVPGEFSALGLDFHKRGEMTDEYLKIMKEAWTSDNPTYSGKFFRFSDISVLPKPAQKPHPPVWIGGNSRAATRRAALLGDGWHPLFPSAEDVERGVEHIKGLRGDDSLHSFTISYSCSHVLLDGIAGELAPQTIRTRFRGTPEQIAAQFNRLAETGVQHATVRFPHQILGRKGFINSLERFMAEVVPLVR